MGHKKGRKRPDPEDCPENYKPDYISQVRQSVHPDGSVNRTVIGGSYFCVKDLDKIRQIYNEMYPSNE